MRPQLSLSRIYRRDMRRRLKEAGVKRPMAVLRARRQMAGAVGRGSWLSALLDLNRDLHSDGTLDDSTSLYHRTLLVERESLAAS